MHEKIYFLSYANSYGPGQPAQMCRLVWALAVYFGTLRYCKGKIVDIQTGIGLHGCASAQVQVQWV